MDVNKKGVWSKHGVVEQLEVRYAVFEDNSREKMQG